MFSIVLNKLIRYLNFKFVFVLLYDVESGSGLKRIRSATLLFTAMLGTIVTDT